MGINNLWEVLEPAATTVPIVSLAVSDRYVGPAPHSPYVVGIDARSVSTSRVFPCSTTYDSAADGLNNDLSVSARSTHVRHPVQLIFCYDGDQRPDVKRGHRVSTKDHWMVQPTQCILNVFNMQWITAAGEAEAQLALMNNAGIIDAVMTDDSDAFVFGAQTVLRNSSFSADATATIKMYTTSSIQERVEPHLTIDGFMTMAVCCGGDYDNNGLPGCGRETALGLVRCMNTSVLRDAGCGRNLPDQTLERWRMDARYHLMDDPTALPDSFPNQHILNLYAKPAVTPLTELPILHSPAPPDLAPLALLVQQLLGWDPKKLVSSFRSNIWPIVVLHELLEDIAKNSPASDEIDLAPGCTRVVFKCRVRRPKKVLAGIAGHNNDVPICDLERATLQLLPTGSSKGSDDVTQSTEYIRVWLADDIYDCWVRTMFPMSPEPSTSHAIDLEDNTMDDDPASSAATVSSSSYVDIIDLTQDEGGDHEIIDLTV
ncbi:PIN domain-like protein [Suillus subluteus]|nr:PIN domain-like protein [Suillus subluteus]